MGRPNRAEQVRRAAVRQRHAQGSQEPKELDLSELARLACHPTKPLLPTQREFIFYPERISLFMGPVGSAKTTSACAKHILLALLYPGSRTFVSRKHLWTLKETTYKIFKECVERISPDLILDERLDEPHTLWLAPAKAGGEPSAIIFHSLDDLGKLGGMLFNFALVDEVSEVEEEIITTLNGRLRYQRPEEDHPNGPFLMSLITNPVRRSHWVHRKFCGESDCDPVPWGRKFKPTRKENERNLPDGYYEDLSRGYTPEQRIRFIDGECGPDPAGQRVFPEFRHSLHVADLKYNPGLPMIRGWDFGRRRPACVWMQPTSDGGYNYLLAQLGEMQRTDVFAQDVLMMSRIKFPGVTQWIDYCDPHGTAMKSVADVSEIQMLNKMGIHPRYRDVRVETGLQQMSLQLSQITKSGRPKAMFDRLGCSLLIEGYAGGYTYQEVRPGHSLKEEPLKDGFYEHLMDANRYIAVNLGLGSTTPLDQHKRVLRRPRSSFTGY